jgi:hypothetical protein
MRSFCSGATPPNTVVQATSRSIAASSSPSRAGPATGSPTSSPARAASAATVRGSSPKSTLSATPRHGSGRGPRRPRAATRRRARPGQRRPTGAARACRPRRANGRRGRRPGENEDAQPTPGALGDGTAGQRFALMLAAASPRRRRPGRAALVSRSRWPLEETGGWSARLGWGVGVVGAGVGQVILDAAGEHAHGPSGSVPGRVPRRGRAGRPSPRP